MKTAVVIAFIAVLIAVLACKLSTDLKKENGESNEKRAWTDKSHSQVPSPTAMPSASYRVELPPWKTLVIGVPGLRWDFLKDLVEGSHLRSLIRNGVHAPQGIFPVFPTTPVSNLHSTVTGLHPARHGIVADEFYDRKLDKTFGVGPYTYIYDKKTRSEDTRVSSELGKKIYGGEAIWKTFEGHVACMYWPGCEFGGLDESHLVRFDKEAAMLPWDERINNVKQWLKTDTINLILMTYWDLMDFPSLDGMKNEMKTFDNQIFEMAKILTSDLPRENLNFILNPTTYLLEKLNLNVIIIGAGGVQKLFSEEVLLPTVDKLPEYFDVRTMEPAMWLVEPENDEEKERTVEYFEQFEKITVYERDAPKTTPRSVPKKWHYSNNADRMPSVIVLADKGYRLSVKRGTTIHDKNYAAGYDMFGIGSALWPAFVAYGPAFEKGQAIDLLKMATVNVHFLLCKLARKTPPPGTDSVLPASLTHSKPGAVFSVEKYMEGFLSDEFFNAVH